MRIGIADTTFARYDMGAAAIDELKKNASDSRYCSRSKGSSSGKQKAY